jgi:hypothetical protein
VGRNEDTMNAMRAAADAAEMKAVLAAARDW